MLRIVSWNVNLSLKAKWSAIIALHPDLAILPEVSRADLEFLVPQTAHRDWIGDNERKGLGVATFGDYTLSRDASFDPKYQFFLPTLVAGPTPMGLLGVWALNHRNRTELAGQRDATLQAITYYRPFLERCAETIVAGDFNHNVIWDRPTRTAANFSRVLAALSELSLESAYHHVNAELQGQESRPTLNWQRNVSKPYHVDYCFVPRSWLDAELQLQVVQPAPGRMLSDHLALILDVSPPA